MKGRNDRYFPRGSVALVATAFRVWDSVKNIGPRMFEGCSGLKTVTVGNGAMYIGSLAFADCKNLTSVNIPDSVVALGEYSKTRLDMGEK